MFFNCLIISYEKNFLPMIEDNNVEHVDFSKIYDEYKDDFDDDLY
jgi:hypothetical protein